MLKRSLVLGALGAAFALPAQAGLYADDLSRCLVEKSTPEDKNALIRWVIAITTLHPAVRPVAQVDAEARARTNQAAARIFERLLTQQCLAPTRLAIRYEGAAAIQAGFQTLGQIAMVELFADPGVAAALGELDQAIDAQKLREALQAPDR